MKDISPTKKSPIEEYNKGTKKEQEIHQEAETSKLHTLRGGSAGCILEDGTILGTSPFQALARFMGYQFPVEGRTHKIFSNGFANEHTWEEKMTAAGVPYLCEEDIPLKYQVGGYNVTGRPDMVVGSYMRPVLSEDETRLFQSFKPEYGIEFKSMVSVNTAKKIFEDHKPKDDNFIQSCHYMYKFGIPWVLIYSNNSIFTNFEYIRNMYDKKGNRITSVFDEDSKRMYIYKKDERGQIDPQDMEFPIGLEDGRFYYIDPNGERIDTLVTTKGIDDYYKLIIKMYETKDLSLAKLSNTDMFGNKIFYDTNLYDLWQLMARPKDYDHDLDKWAERIAMVVKQPYRIQVRQKKYQITLEGEVINSYDTYEQAIGFIENPIGGFKL